MFRSSSLDTCARALRLACVIIITTVTLAAIPVSAEAGAIAKVAFFNIRAGKGGAGLPGRVTPFTDTTTNCTDTSAALNAWGVGFVQRELQAKLGSDPDVIALGLAEARLCGSPENVRRALGWKARSESRNGLGIVARHGFSGPVTFIQLDTSLSTSTEPRYALHAPVCVDASCSASFDVFALHTAAKGTYKVDSMVQQMEQVVAFMAGKAGTRPRALLGDFNVYEEHGGPCSSPWSSRPLDALRRAGYVDGWRAVHGTAPGFTGTTNRAGCGSPEGATYKRIDYAWSLGMKPTWMWRFGMTPPGEATSSDHVGIVADYEIDGVQTADVTAPAAAVAAPAEGATVAGTVAVTANASDAGGVRRVDFLADGALIGTDTVAPFSASWNTTGLSDGVHMLQVRATDAAGNIGSSSMRSVIVANPLDTVSGSRDVVLHASAASVAGRWQIVPDATAASGRRLYNPNLGAAKASSALAAPTSYADLTFYAEKGKAYRLWMRGRAEANSWANDSVFVQFSDSVNATNGAAVWRIGTRSATTVQVEEGTGARLAGWGWADNMWGGVGPLVSFATTGEHRIRLQIREDGMSIDQIVLSADTYVSSAPGSTKNDTTLLSTSTPIFDKTISDIVDATEVVLYASEAAAFGAWRRVLDPAAAGGALVRHPNAGTARLATALAAPGSYMELTFTADAGRPYRLWLRGKAEQNSWTNDSVFVQFSDAVDANGAPLWKIGSRSATWVSLEECSGCGVSGWGWQDNGYGSLGTMGPLVRFAKSGVHTIRIQSREDGFSIDQVVLSSDRYLTVAPGASRNDTTILAR